MTDVQDLLEARHAWDLTSSELVGESLQGSDLQQDLDLVDWLALAGHSYAKTVMGEGSEPVLVNSLVDIRVVVVVVRKVPVAASR